MNTAPTLTPPNTDPSSQRQIITARMVGWALSGATIGSLLLGLLVVEYFGRVSNRPQLETDPEPLVSKNVAPKERPTILRSMGRDEPTDQEPPGFQFRLPPEAEAKSTPRIDTAAQQRRDWQ